MGDENCMKLKRMNKHGAVILRDLLFMIIIFSIIMVLAGLFVTNMASEYSNTEMEDEYNAQVGGLSSLIYNVSSDTEEMRDTTVSSNESVISSLTSSTGIITGAGKILVTLFKIPGYAGSSLGIILTALRVPDPIPEMVQITVNLFIYGILIFVIISALLKGGKV